MVRRTESVASGPMASRASATFIPQNWTFFCDHDGYVNIAGNSAFSVSARSWHYCLRPFIMCGSSLLPRVLPAIHL